MRRCFDSLSKREKDIIGKSFGVYDYPKESQRDIAMYHMIKEKAAEKAKRRVQKNCWKCMIRTGDSADSTRKTNLAGYPAGPVYSCSCE